MNRSTTNRFLANAFRILCCIGALTASSSWANIITLESKTTSVTARDLPSSAYTTTARGIDNMPSSESSQISFQSSIENEVAAGTNAPVTETSRGNTEVYQESSAVSSRSTQSQTSFSVSASETTPQVTGGAIASAFDEDFVSVPTVQFVSAAASGPREVSMSSMSSSDGGAVPVPELSAFFPILGLIAAVSCTQVLRRRRAAQKTASIV